MSHEVLTFSFVDGSQERVWHGSPRYRELLADGHTPVGSLPVPSGISDQLEAHLATAYVARVVRPPVWAIGDSMTSSGVAPGKGGSRQAGAAILGPLSYAGWALLQTGGRFVYGGTGATPGFTSAQVRATHLPEAVAAAPGVCVILTGTNDTAGGNDLAVMVDIAYMATELRRVGTVPVLCTIPPQGVAPVAFVSRLNARIRTYARANGIPCVDFHRTLVQAATGGLGPAYNSGDGIHPNSLGARTMGDLLAATLNSMPGQPATPSFVGGFDTAAMMRDGCYQVITGHWAQAGSGATVGLTTGASWKGSKTTLVAGGAGNNKFLTGTLSSQPVAGNRVSVLARVDAPTVPASGKWSAILGDTGGGTVTGYLDMDQALPVGSVVAFDFTAVAAQINANPWTVNYSVSGAGTTALAAAETSVLNLSALGIE